MKELILGGMRSGKSRIAEKRAIESGLKLFYIATATSEDEEMRQRIIHHQNHRSKDWRLIETPIELVKGLQQHADDQHCLLVDCLTMWMTNLIGNGSSKEIDDFKKERDALISLWPSLPGQIILVSNEVGMGVVPLGKLSRLFVDEAGRLHQALASCCDRVTLCVAGLQYSLKG